MQLQDLSRLNNLPSFKVIGGLSLYVAVYIDLQ